MNKLNSKIKEKQKENKTLDLQSADLGRVHLRVIADVCF